MPKTHFTVAGCCLWLAASGSLSAENLLLSISNDAQGLVLAWPAWASDAVLEQSSVGSEPLAWRTIFPGYYQSNSSFFYYRVTPPDAEGLFRVRRTGPPVAGLSGYWSLDEGAGSISMEASGFASAMFMTNVSWAAGRFGAGSIQLNGQDPAAGGSMAWINNTNFAVLPSNSNPFSLSFWFSPDNLPLGDETVVGNDANGGDGWHVSLRTSGPGTNYFVLTSRVGGASLGVTGRTLLLPRRWYELTIESGGGQSGLYLNGNLLAQMPGALWNGSGPLYFGSVPGIQGAFAGRVDQIRAYKILLTTDQISLTGKWHFDENGGGLAFDSSVQGHLASVTDPTGWTTGRSGSGIDLAASSVVIPNEDYSVLPQSGGPFSISCWICPRTLSAGQSELLSCTAGTNAGWQLMLDCDGFGQCALEFTSTNTGGTLALRAPVALTNGAWSKLDLTYNGAIGSLYVNGGKAGSDSGAIRGARAPLVLGASMKAFDGTLDELEVYRRERTDSEIGPVAQPMWEMALVNSTTNLVLQGSGPLGKHLTYSVVSAPAPSMGSISWSSDSPNILYAAGAQKGPATFVYTVSDGDFTSPPATAVVSVVQAHWLSPTGGATQPLDGSSPAHAWLAGAATALDDIWRTNNYYDCFFYAPGEYQTTGWNFNIRGTANAGCKHIGSGSDGSSATVLKLVNTWGTWDEGVIFAPRNQFANCDGFEVRNMMLDCNAQNNPKYAVGEPVWLRIPLIGTSLVNQVTVSWNNAFMPGNGLWRLGPASQFSLSALTPSTDGSITNTLSLVSTGAIDTVTIGTNTDQLLLQLTKRADGVDFYSINEIQVSGAAVSLPLALDSAGADSRLDAQHTILRAVDGDGGSSWASGVDDQVQIMLPLEPGSAVSQLQLQWNCQTLADLHRLGPAVQYFILARDPVTAQLVNVPFVSSGRSAAGLETATFSGGPVNTDQIVLQLAARETGVDYYSLKEVRCANGGTPVPWRVPTAASSLFWAGSFPALRAFDGDPTTAWASGTQGSVTAINVLGNNLKFTQLKIVGFGTKALRECFPLAMFAPAISDANPIPFRNVLVEDCVMGQPATNNADGISAMAIAGEKGSIVNATVRRSSVSGLRHFFAYSHGIAAPIVEGCLVDDCDTAVYFEPDPSGSAIDSMGPVILRSNVFANVIRGIALDFHPGGHFGSIAAIGNEFILSTNGGGYSLTACDTCVPGPSGTLTNVTALNNIIRYPDWTPRSASAEGGFQYTDIRNAVYANNIIALGTKNSLRIRPYPTGLVPGAFTPEDCDHPGIPQVGPSSYPPSLDPAPPDHRLAWCENRDASGELVPVYFFLWGVEGLAIQQQWPE